MRIRAVLASFVLLLLTAGTVAANHATNLNLYIGCTGVSVEVTYSQFGGGHHLVTSIVLDGAAPIVHDETPNGAGTKTYTIAGAYSSVSVTVTTPQDNNPPLVKSATREGSCQTPTPTPDSTSTPTSTPEATATPTIIPTPVATNTPTPSIPRSTPSLTLPPTATASTTDAHTDIGGPLALVLFVGVVGLILLAPAKRRQP